jgi:hypothetical protein
MFHCYYVSSTNHLSIAILINKDALKAYGVVFILNVYVRFSYLSQVTLADFGYPVQVLWFTCSPTSVR